MKLYLAVALLAAGAMAAPNKEAYNPYVWRPGKAIDMNKFQSVNMKVDPVGKFNNPNKMRFPMTPVGTNPAALGKQGEECGIENKSAGKVTNGEEAQPNQFPWTAVVLIGGTGLCTGSLVHPNWVLTAGHCVTASSYTIQLGAHDRTDPNEPNKIEIDTTESHQHPEYNPITLQGDMGLIRLPEPAPLSENIRLSCLPTRSDETNSFEGELCTITGWGRTSDLNPAASDVLRFAKDRPIISNEECRSNYPLNVYDTTICTANHDTVGTCNGDSGGPLNMQRDGPYLQIGVTSYVSSAGCESDHPDGFSRVTEYFDWLEETSGNDIVIEA